MTPSQPVTLIHESSNSRIYHQPDSEFGRPVVIKTLNTSFPTPQQLVRYNNEYELTKDLAIDGVRQAIAQIRLEDKPALVLEYFAGQNLKQAFVAQPQALTDLVAVAICLADALGCIHQHHIIHQDINSSNVLVDLQTKQVKIIDFGLASRIDLRVQHVGNPEWLGGTLAYISPEQTGRMNRAVDYRTDLYSLGVTLYELLTGTLPFVSDDPFALVHAHIAKAPQPVTALNPLVPPMVSDIVMKLLAKNAQDRYQSAFGLKADLERCLEALANAQASGRRVDMRFSLAQDDYSGQLHIPEKLYGRSAEIAALSAAFGRVAAGGHEFVLVAGYPGVGKSALVAEIQQVVAAQRGHLISGKFDQYQQNAPYAAFTQAFDQFAQLLLTQREKNLQSWRNSILAALGSNGAVLTEVMPGLEKVIGAQPAVPKLGGQENRNRFNLAFRSLLQAIGTAEHPLVVFVDDWQWADLASLELLRVLLTGEAIAHLLLIGAYRDSGLDPAHPLRLTLDQLSAAGVKAQTVELHNLCPEDVRQLVRESLAGSAADSQALADLVYAKTRGNAFFTRQFLQHLYQENWLRFDFGARRWMWDIDQIAAQNITDNVVDLMNGRLKKLSAETGHVLQLAACMGNEFDLQTLALIGRTNVPKALKGLAEALTEGLVIPLDDYYKLPDTAGQARFRFSHDRVQQAAYAQIPAPEQQAVHLQIGRLLLANASTGDLAQRVFDIVRHYDHAVPILTEDTERLRLADLNVQAADQAYEAAALQSAQAYLKVALALMPEDAWNSQYDRMLKIHSQLASVSSLTGDVEQFERAYRITLAQAHTIADTAQVKQANIQVLLARGNYADAIDLGMSFIEAMGVTINRNPTAKEAFQYLSETAEWLTEERIQSLPELGEASADVGLVHQVAVMLNGPTYNTNMNLCFVSVSRITRLCYEQGLTPWAPVTLATFALLLSAALHDIPKARLLTNVTMQLFDDRYRSDVLVPSLSVALGGFVVQRYSHLKETMPILAEGVRTGLATGEFQFVGYCAWYHAWHYLQTGAPLAKVEENCRQAVETCRQVHMERIRDWSLLLYQATLNLQGKSKSPWVLAGDTFDEEDKLAFARQINDLAEVFRILIYKAWLRFLFDQRAAAVELFRETESYLLYSVGHYLIPLFHFYDTLANAAVFRQQTAEDQRRILERIDGNLEQIETWVAYAPMNHQHKKDLMEAEKARLEGRYWQAVALYEQAIQGAKQNEFLHEEALAVELYAKFWLEQGHRETGLAFIRRAESLYSLWGAAAKVNQLQAAYGAGLSLEPLNRGDREPSALAPPIAYTPSSTWLDIDSLLKANHTLSQTVQTGDLLAQMVTILLQNAGAERALILFQDEGDWFVEASGRVDGAGIQTGLHWPLSETSPLSLGVFNYVVRSGKYVMLPDAAQDRQFGGEPYLREHGAKSVLCLPIWHKGRLALVLYLENNLAAGAFTANRLELLQLLSGQMAISLENARMYEHLQALIVEHKQTAQALQAKTLELDRYFTDALDLLCIADTDGYFRRLNKEWESALGYPIQELEGQRFLDYVHPDDVPSTVQALSRLTAQKQVMNFLNRYRAKDGSYRWIEWRSYAYGKRVYAAARDITERREAEQEIRRLNEELERRVVERTAQLEAANRELEAFAYSISHDLRAPLRAIGGYTHILLEDYEPILGPEGQRICGVVRHETERMNQLIDDLLAFSRLSRAELRAAAIDMTSLVHEVFDALTAPGERNRIDLRVAALPPAMGDVALMRQVWTNLLANAIKFSGKRDRARIDVGMQPGDRETIYYVADNGAGFDMNYAGKLFGVFQRLHSDKEFPGTGVGLAIVQRIIHRHGGRVWAEGTVDQGATVFFSLPQSDGS